MALARGLTVHRGHALIAWFVLLNPTGLSKGRGRKLMYNLPTTPSWRPSGPIAPEVGVYRAPRSLSYRAIGAIAGALAMLAFAISLFLWLTGGQ